MAITETRTPPVPGSADIRVRRNAAPSRTRSAPSRTRGLPRDRGQTAIEFLGVTPLIILLMIALWQCALIGYTFSLAGNAADEGAHRGAVTEGARGQECRDAVEQHLPKAWRDSLKKKDCRARSDLYTAEVKLQVPILVPGILNWKFPVTGYAAAPLEG